jgi:hypothetical protein
MVKYVPNQLKPNLLSVCGLNPWPGHVSSSRVQMFSSHLAQCLVIKGATERRNQTGMEAEFGKYTFNVKMPVDGEIIKIFKRYQTKLGNDTIRENPQTILMYEDHHTKEIGIVNLTNYFSNHQYFGFEYVPQPALKGLHAGAFVAKDTIFLESPNITKNGGYKYGRECNIAYMSHPAISEDGILICRDVLDLFKFKIYETRVVEWGSRKFPLNLYGDETNFKGFPDIGDPVREDGLLMCLRPYDDKMAPVEQSIYDLQEPDFIFDKATYAPAGGKVIDIRVYHDNSPVEEIENFPMENQPNKYNTERIRFYKEIVAEVKRLYKLRGESLRITPELQQLMVTAQVAIDSDQKRINKLYRQVPLDDWRVEFTIEYEITPNVGFKATDCVGTQK